MPAGGRSILRRIDRPPRTGTLLGAALAGVVLLASLGCSSGTSDCAESVTFGERTYVGTDIQEEDAFTAQDVVGFGLTPPCGDDVGEVEAVGQRELVSIEGVAPELALLDGDRDDLVYVATGRCSDAEGWEAFAACLRERLSFRDRWYARAAVEATPAEEAAGQGVLFAPGGDSAVEVAALEGIAPERAVSAAGATWVADGVCYEDAPANLGSCLTGG
jgi:Family of unknown function (DUF6281)